VDKLVLLVALILPEWDRWWQPGVNHHFDQLSAGVCARQKVAELQPIKTSTNTADGTAYIRLIYQN
jgi:hypothetical protein